MEFKEAITQFKNYIAGIELSKETCLYNRNERCSLDNKKCKCKDCQSYKRKCLKC
ncbi:hypothetical protein [Inconstantimicrobium mannanitabidum]|uniref:Uncharacterized protein n=1 Tax=Inconstantimicrobium mannanitabidum TaxID=1604901 RepID=A0ACB5R910_9CLOT|nr:hypothetical protein [Clostridium sp. TW13]GKX65622.1 hypothetical protein rsdtw13_08800 [Clostridium sp. TW13]